MHYESKICEKPRILGLIIDYIPRTTGEHESFFMVIEQESFEITLWRVSWFFV